MKKVVKTIYAPKAIGPYSQAVIANGFIFVSGQLPINPMTNTINMDITGATRRALTNVKSILDVAGSSMEKVVKVTVYLTNMQSFAAMNEAYKEFFPDGDDSICPARACVEVHALPKGAVIEIDAVATIE